MNLREAFAGCSRKSKGNTELVCSSNDSFAGSSEIGDEFCLKGFGQRSPSRSQAGGRHLQQPYWDHVALKEEGMKKAQSKKTGLINWVSGHG